MVGFTGRLAIACLLTLVPYASFAGVTKFGVIPGVENAPEMRPTAEMSPESTRSGWVEAGDALISLIPSSKLNCVKDVLGNTFFARTQFSGNTDVWKSNSGVKAYNQLRLSQSPCLAILTERYYADINKKTDPKDGKDRIKDGRPSLGSKVGQGSYREQQPGFALKSAMAISQGNRALAMALIGHCGHDDIENSLPTVVDFAKSSESKTSIIGYLNNIGSAAKENVRKDPKSTLNRLISTVNSGGRASLSVKCPQSSSAFYAARALGTEVDISDDLRRSVAKSQAPTKGMNVLPGKAYHTTFAAVMGCKLGACGLSSDTSAKILATVANRYRTSRLFSTTQKYDAVRLLIEANFGVNWSDTAGLKREEAAIRAWMESEAGKKEMIAAGADEFFALNRAFMTWEMWKKNIDAATLARSGPSGQVWSAPPMSAGRDPYFIDGTGNRPQQSFCPGWPEERCTAARERRDTWQADFDLTEGQQTVGGQFGAKFCEGQPPGDAAVEKQACQALQRLDIKSAVPAETAPPASTTGVD